MLTVGCFTFASTNSTTTLRKPLSFEISINILIGITLMYIMIRILLATDINELRHWIKSVSKVLLFCFATPSLIANKSIKIKLGDKQNRLSFNIDRSYYKSPQ